MILTALGNHLWASTLYAATAGFLALILRKYHARVRYWVWLTASIKFLIPFSLLVAIGSRLAWFSGPPVVNSRLHVAIEVISGATTTAVSDHLLPTICRSLAMWFSGSAFPLVRAVEEDVRYDTKRDVFSRGTRS